MTVKFLRLYENQGPFRDIVNGDSTVYVNVAEVKYFKHERGTPESSYAGVVGIHANDGNVFYTESSLSEVVSVLETAGAIEVIDLLEGAPDT